MTPSLDLSNEDEMIDLSTEDSENVNPNIQAGQSKKDQEQIKPPPSAAFLQTDEDEEKTPITGTIKFIYCEKIFFRR